MYEQGCSLTEWVVLESAAISHGCFHNIANHCHCRCYCHCHRHCRDEMRSFPLISDEDCNDITLLIIIIIIIIIITTIVNTVLIITKQRNMVTVATVLLAVWLMFNQITNSAPSINSIPITAILQITIYPNSTTCQFLSHVIASLLSLLELTLVSLVLYTHPQVHHMNDNNS